LAAFFRHFHRCPVLRPLTVELLAAEAVECNEPTVLVETEREQWTEQAAHVLGGAAFAARDAARWSQPNASSPARRACSCAAAGSASTVAPTSTAARAATERID
jgi:hypothetical protein